MTSDSRVTSGRVFLLALVPALLVARCGIWPSFPDELLSGDAGTTDARADATTTEGGSRDGGDAGDATLTDGNMATDVVTDVATDTAPAAWYGFRSCAAAPMTMAAAEPAFPRSGVGSADAGDAGFTQVMGITTPRDIAFDGAGKMIVAGRDSGGVAAAVFIITAAGAVSTLYSASQGSISGARFLTNGNVLVSGSFSMGASVVPGVTMLDSSGMVQGRLAFPTGFPWAALAQEGGGFTSFDSTIENQIVQFTGGPLPGTLPSRVDTSMATPPAPTQQRAGALSADGRHMFVVSQDNGLIHEYEVSAAGVINGATRRVYVNLGSTAFPRSLAFDECGNLYVSATAMVGGTSTGAVLRVPPRGGMSFVLSTFEQTDSQRTVAFGLGSGFSNLHLYVADVSTQIIRRIPIGIAGQPVAAPGSGMMMMPRDM